MILEGVQFEDDYFVGEPEFIGKFSLSKNYMIVAEWFEARNNQEQDFCVLKLFKIYQDKAFYERIISKYCWYSRECPEDVMEIDNVGFGGSIWVNVRRYRYEKDEKIGVLRRW